MWGDPHPAAGLKDGIAATRRLVSDSLLGRDNTNGRMLRMRPIIVIL